MNKKTQSKCNAGGRPLSYDPRLVHEIIRKGIEDGVPAADLDTAFVKAKLCSEHNVKDTIRQERLEGLVQAVHEELAEVEEQCLLAALPDTVTLAVGNAVAAIGRELQLIVARQHSICQAIADQKCEEVRTDKRNAQFRIMELEAALADQQNALLRLEQERDEAKRKLAEAQKQLHIATSEVDRLSREPSSVDRLLQELRNPAVRDDIRATLSQIVATTSSPSAE
ncbi:hypothetical protein K3720_13680 [Leisingera caerulea]|uniref:hypothetical protein n=1 Tax=Leisingera caerulea TaxID=506591 RepID=UPI0021A4B3BF|nr:hypothetical protein [Leisingera caerulea]UWQ48964.1 hypothetical protein K3720_13680 [Leisingera caerulea]